jgi:hypothetical protein
MPPDDVDPVFFSGSWEMTASIVSNNEAIDAGLNAGMCAPIDAEVGLSARTPQRSRSTLVTLAGSVLKKL